MNWETISIFISSTFNDMHAERDYLIKNVFPELAEWCEKRRIRLVDIDLRWGVTAEESCNNHALRKCLENIDDTNRFFLCLIGQRRGWVPNENREELERRRNQLIYSGIDPDTYPPKYSEISEETTVEYPELIERDRNPALRSMDQSKPDNYKSVTEIEIEHALLEPMYRMIGGKRKNPEDKPRTVFFQRIDNFTHRLSKAQKKIYTNIAAPDPAWADRKTEELKREIRVKISPRDLISYSGEWDKRIETPELSEEIMDGLKVGKKLTKGRLVNFMAGDRELKDVVIEELRKLILDKYDREKEFVSDADRYVKDREQQELFVQTATDGYVHRSDIENELNVYINDENDEGKSGKSLLLTAEAGLGKTTLLAQYVKQNNEQSLFDVCKGIYRFCGISDLTTDPYTLWDSICSQVKIEMPESYEKLKQNIPQVLSAIVEKGYRHIVIDAVNQMTDGENMLQWLPEVLPAGLKVILSIKLTAANKGDMAELQSKFSLLHVGKLADFSVKKSLIEQFLKRYLKAFDEKQIEDICGIKIVDGKQIPAPAHSSDNPLHLKVILHELHFFGSFTKLPDEIKKYKSSPKEAFMQMLKRLEEENNAYVEIMPSDSVPFLFGLLAQARNGLSEDEILHCFKFHQKFTDKTDHQILGAIRFYLRQVRPFMARSAGRLDFLYDEFKTAAGEIYPENLHFILAQSLFDVRPAECAYHARQAYNRDYLKKIYTNLDFLNRYYAKDGSHNLSIEIQKLEKGIIPEEIQKFIIETAALLAKYPKAAPETFYKELPSAYKTAAEALCENPWIKMDQVALPIALTKAMNVGPEAIQPLEIRSGHIAGVSLEAFFLISANEIQIVNMNNLQTVSKFMVATDSEIEKIFVSPEGDFLVTVLRDSFSIFQLFRDANKVVIFSEKKLDRECSRIRFESACVFVAGNRLIYQTIENELFTITLDFTLYESPFSQSGNHLIQENSFEYRLCGYFPVENTHYYVFKKNSNQYFIYAIADNHFINYELTSNINDMQSFNGQLVILLDNKALIITESTISFAHITNCDFVPKSGARLGDSMLLTSEQGQIYRMSSDGKIKDYGMLSVGRWDMKNRIYAVGDKKVFFFSDHRYALIGETQKTNISIIKAKISNNSSEMLFVDENNSFRLKTQKTDKIISKDILLYLPYGLTSLMNYRCDWNSEGDVLHQGNGVTAEMTMVSGRQIPIDPPEMMSAIFDIQYLKEMGVFIILYHNGKISMVDSRGEKKDSETFKSSSRNYLLCDCGKYFCIIARRRLVQQATLFEETALAIHDQNGQMVFETHYNGIASDPVQNITYDSAENILYVITTKNVIRYDLSRGFIADKHLLETFIPDSCGLAVNNGLLYYHQQEQGLCVLDLKSGKRIANLPTHRSISNISPCTSGIAVMENNEIIYQTK